MKKHLIRLAMFVLIVLAMIPEAHAAALKEDEKTVLYMAGLAMAGVLVYLGVGKLWALFSAGIRKDMQDRGDDKK